MLSESQGKETKAQEPKFNLFPPPTLLTGARHHAGPAGDDALLVHYSADLLGLFGSGSPEPRHVLTNARGAGGLRPSVPAPHR